MKKDIFTVEKGKRGAIASFSFQILLYKDIFSPVLF